MKYPGLILITTLIMSCSTQQEQSDDSPLEDPAAFVTRAERHYEEFGEYRSRVSWLRATYINFDSNWLFTRVNAEDTAHKVEFAKAAARYNKVEVSPELRRKLERIKLGLNLAAADEPGAATRLAETNSRMATLYSTGTVQLGDKTVSRNDLETLMGTVRDPRQLAQMWHKWREVTQPMAADYANMVSLANQGARELGYADTGEMWRLRYEMPADEFSAEMMRLWAQVSPLYKALHCHVRAKLNQAYGDDVVPPDSPIRADLLGNMWAQSWSNIYDLLLEDTAQSPVPDLSQRLVSRGYTPEKMVRAGEDFFSSLGFAPLPETFWQRSMLSQPQGRNVVCHASAWNLDGADDLRIKMCTKVNANHFYTVYHELGHNYYQRAYKGQSPLFRSGANSGFHEAIGDMIALSITPEYLRQIGLIEQMPPKDQDLGLLMRQALDKVAFLPFGLLLDQWRWQVFAGEIAPEDYNTAWWALRHKYQGLRPATPREATHFDPGSKFHIANNVSYTRYFIAHILQFQLHEAACKIAGWNPAQPLHRCSIYHSKAAGKKFADLLAAGAAKPWPETLAAFTGSTAIDGQALLNYFAPLSEYLEAQNATRQCGW